MTSGSGRRGASEDQATKLAQMSKASEQLTAVGLPSTTIIWHPLEGPLFLGEAHCTRQLKHLIQTSAMAQEVASVQVKKGSMINFVSTRKEKEAVMQRTFKTNLPLFPLPFGQMGFHLLVAQLGSVIEVETAGTKFKFGDSIPEEIKEWFEEEDEVFKCIKSSGYTNQMNALLKAKGTTVSNLYRKLLSQVYSLRLGGNEHVELFHHQQTEEDIVKLFNEKKIKEEEKEKETEAERQRKAETEKRPEEQKGQDKERERVEEKKRENLEDDNDFAEEEFKEELTNEEIQKRLSDDVGKKLTKNAMVDMHKDAKTTGEKTVVQVIKKNIENEKVVSLMLSDGEFVSANVVPADEELAESIKELEENDVIEITEASVKGDKLIVEYISKLGQVDAKGKTLRLKKPVKKPGVPKLRKISAEQLTLWGLKFNKETNVELNQKEDLEETIVDEDPVIKKAGKKISVTQHLSASQPTVSATRESKRPKLQCSVCVKSFTSADTLKRHMSVNH